MIGISLFRIIALQSTEQTYLCETTDGCAYLCAVSVLEVSGRDEKIRDWNLFQYIIPGIMSWKKSQHRGTTCKGTIG